MIDTIRRIIDRRWIDEHDIIHAQVMEISTSPKWVHVFLVCTNQPTPLWGQLADNYTYNPATCLWCIAEEQQGDKTK